MPAWDKRHRRWKRKPYRPHYNASHRAKRNALAPMVALGVVDCARCGERIQVGEPWDSRHCDGSGVRYAGPEHRRCNRATARHRKEREMYAEQNRPRSREW